MQVDEIRVIGRNTQGVRLIEMEPGERVAAVARLAERDDDSEGPEVAGADPSDEADPASLPDDSPRES
jgi:DNA gyrase subunit A